MRGGRLKLVKWSIETYERFGCNGPPRPPLPGPAAGACIGLVFALGSGVEVESESLPETATGLGIVLERYRAGRRRVSPPVTASPGPDKIR